MLKFRLADNYGCDRSQQMYTPTGAHFNSPGHTLGDLLIPVIERSRKTTTHTEYKERSTKSTDLTHIQWHEQTEIKSSREGRTK